MPTDTATLVDDVLASMKEAATSGAPDALAALKAKTSWPAGHATPPPPAGTTAAPRPAGATAGGPLTATSKTITRPNGQVYHVRKLGDHDDIAVLRRARDKGIPFLGYGDPGTGKTAMVEAAFAPEGSGETLHTVQGSGDTDVLEFVGTFIQLPDGKFEWVDGPLILAMERGEVLYIDEIALPDPKVMSVVYGVMDGRGVLNVTQNPDRGDVVAKPGFYVAASCNPDAPGARMSEALLSRFQLQVKVTTDYNLAKMLGVPVNVVGAAQNLATKKTNGEISWAPQLRELLSYVSIEREFGVDVALRNLVSSAPERDRTVVSDVVGRKFSKTVKELELGK
jgi:MoxR-like ATPase